MEFGFLSFTIAEMCTHMNAMIRIRTAIRLMRKRHDGSDRPPTRPGIERTICAWRWQWAKKRATCAGAATLRRGCSASLQTWNRAATRRNLPKIRTKGHSEIWLTRLECLWCHHPAAGDPCLLDMATTSIQRGLVEEVDRKSPCPYMPAFMETLGKSLEDHCHSL